MANPEGIRGDRAYQFRERKAGPFHPGPVRPDQVPGLIDDEHAIADPVQDLTAQIGSRRPLLSWRGIYPRQTMAYPMGQALENGSIVRSETVGLIRCHDVSARLAISQEGTGD